MESERSHSWKMNPITEYWKNHAVTEAGPTVRNGVAGPSLKTIESACQG